MTELAAAPARSEAASQVCSAPPFHMSPKMHIVFVRDRPNPENALQRLYSNPLHEGLRSLGIETTMVHAGLSPAVIEPPSHVIVHQNDEVAILTAVPLKTKASFKLICLCSDIYDLSALKRLSDSVDLFLVPTPLHADMLQSIGVRKVAVLPEAVDPIARPGADILRPLNDENRLCWFGYPESFEKSLRYLLPDAFTTARFDVSRFGIISSEHDRLLPGAEHRLFSAGSFYETTKDYSYSLLSHFAYDLHINTFIKSPNKMITALVRGMIPLVSATPSYEATARRFGLEPLMFKGPADLAALLQNLDSQKDRVSFGMDEIAKTLLAEFSSAAITQRLLEHIS